MAPRKGSEKARLWKIGYSSTCAELHFYWSQWITRWRKFGREYYTVECREKTESELGFWSDWVYEKQKKHVGERRRTCWHAVETNSRRLFCIWAYCFMGWIYYDGPASPIGLLGQLPPLRLLGQPDRKMTPCWKCSLTHCIFLVRFSRIKSKCSHAHSPFTLFLKKKL